MGQPSISASCLCCRAKWRKQSRGSQTASLGQSASARNTRPHTGLEGLACAAASQGRSEDAVRLYGAAEKLRKDIRVPRTVEEDQLYSKYIEQAKHEIGLEKWANLMIEAEMSPLSPVLTELVKDALRLSGAHG